MRQELIKWGGPQGSACWEKWTRMLRARERRVDSIIIPCPEPGGEEVRADVNLDKLQVVQGVLSHNPHLLFNRIIITMRPVMR